MCKVFCGAVNVKSFWGLGIGRQVERCRFLIEKFSISEKLKGLQRTVLVMGV